MRKIIVCSPLFDEVTEITVSESRVVKYYAESLGIQVIDLLDADAIRENLRDEMLANPDAFLYHADHGSEDKIWGDDDRPVIDLFNVQLMAGRENYMNNCSSAKTLGVEAFKAGANVFWGSKDVVSLTTDALVEFELFFNFGVKRRMDDWENDDYKWLVALQEAKDLGHSLASQLMNDGKFVAATCMENDANILDCYTEEDPPETDCRLRRFLVKVFGKKWGWRIDLPVRRWYSALVSV